MFQVNRSNEPRGDPVAVSSEEDKAFVAELIQLVTDWLAGRAPAGPGSTTAAGPDAARDGLTTDEDAMGSSADDDSAAALGAAAPALDELLLPPLNSYRRLLAYQELRKPQFGVEGHPGFWVKKVRPKHRHACTRSEARRTHTCAGRALELDTGPSEGRWVDSFTPSTCCRAQFKDGASSVAVAMQACVLSAIPANIRWGLWPARMLDAVHHVRATDPQNLHGRGC